MFERFFLKHSGSFQLPAPQGWNSCPCIKTTASLPAAKHAAPLGFPNVTFQMDQTGKTPLGCGISIVLFSPFFTPSLTARCDDNDAFSQVLTWRIIPDFTVKHLSGHLLLSVPTVLLTLGRCEGRVQAQALLSSQEGENKK